MHLSSNKADSFYRSRWAGYQKIVGMMTKRLEKTSENQSPKFYKESLKSSVGEAVRNYVSCLQQATGKPIYRALKGLQGF